MASFKEILASMEQFENIEGNYAQLEPIVLKDLQKNKGMFKGITIEQVKASTKLYDRVVDAYSKRMEDFGIPDDPLIKGLWWLMPTRFKETGGNILKLKDAKHRNIMSNRVKNLYSYLSSQKASESPYTSALSAGGAE